MFRVVVAIFAKVHSGRIRSSMDGRKRETLFTLARLGGAAVLAGVSSPNGSAATTSGGGSVSWVNPKQFGAIGDGASHPLSQRYGTLAQAQAVYPFATTLDQEIDGCAIQAALKAGTKVQLPAGRFRISETLSVRSNTEVAGAGNGTLLIWGTDQGNDHFGMFSANYASGLRLHDFAVSDTSGSKGGYVFQGIRVADVVLDQVTANGMAIAMFDAAYGASETYGSVISDLSRPDFNGCSDVHVTRCTATNVADTPDPRRAGVLFQYCVGWSAASCKFSNVPFGVQWWGGDSDPAADGALANPRKCMHGTVTGIQVVNCVAGVWGSMGSDVNVSSCSVDTASDVGIDFEGCANCSASQNTVRNCVNGNLTCFWLNVDISFVGNTSRQSRADYPHLRVYNASQDVDNRSLTVKGNTFITDQTIGVIDTDHGCVETLQFLNNTLTDTRVDFTANNLRYVTVTDNQLSFTRAATQTFYAIQIGAIHDHGVGVVARNTVASKVSQPPDSTALYLWSDDHNSDSQFQATDNHTTGFPVDLMTDNRSGNPGTTSYFTIEGNTFGSGVYKKQDSGAKRSVSVMRSNLGIPD